MAEQPLLSIVITCYTTDRLKGIFELLDNIKTQTYSRIETVMVIEKSLDLLDAIKGYAAEKSIPNMKLLFNSSNQGASACRNMGAKEAKGEIIAFVDDDALPFNDWAEEMVKSYDDSIIGVTGPAMPLWECPPAKWIPPEFYWIIGCTTWLDCDKVSDVRNVWTMNASFRREGFDGGVFFSTAVGPLDGSMRGREQNKLSEDLEFSLRAKENSGKRIVFNPKVRVKHRIPADRLKWSYIIKWSYWIGASRKTLKRIHKRDKNNCSILDTEYHLLNRIFTRLFPSIIVDTFKRPYIGFRKGILTIVVLSCVSCGYIISSITTALPAKKRLIEEIPVPSQAATYKMGDRRQ